MVVSPLASGRPLLLTVEDIQGSYTIPHIQSGRDLRVEIDFASLPGEAVQATITLRRDGNDEALQQVVDRTTAQANFAALPAAEWSLTVVSTDRTGRAVGSASYRPLGVGSVVAALGDSLTEGYHGHGFKRSQLDLTAADFPPEAVSGDGRNFPQFAPTTGHHKPSVNCFQSWMTRLNNALTVAWQQPVFIANEGWGGYTTAQYLTMMRTNQGGWVDRMRLLQPTVWLIHLGVNDERARVPADAFAATLREIVGLLRASFAAVPEAIYLARPSYDFAPGANSVLQEYSARIDALTNELRMCSGPDFFTAFATDKVRWYGSDPVHPGPEGMDRMADLWLDALAPNPPPGAPGTASAVRPPQRGRTASC